MKMLSKIEELHVLYNNVIRSLDDNESLTYLTKPDETDRLKNCRWISRFYAISRESSASIVTPLCRTDSAESRDRIYCNDIQFGPYGTWVIKRDLLLKSLRGLLQL